MVGNLLSQEKVNFSAFSYRKLPPIFPAIATFRMDSISSDPFWYLYESPVEVEETATADSPTSTTVYTPSTTDTRTAIDDGGCDKVPTTVEPKALLSDIQKAAEDISQLVERFGYKMINTLQQPSVKKRLLAHSNFKQLRLSSLSYSDSFTCQYTKTYENPIQLEGEAPLLWWLWDALLEFLKPSFGKSCKLDFTPAYNADIALPYKISIRLWTTGHGVDNIELTAIYGGQFSERHILDAPISTFTFPERGFTNTTTPLLTVDQIPYKGNGCYNDMLDYLMPRRNNPWRSAMNISNTKERALIEALAGTCKAKDDRFPMSENQSSQCQNLVKRFPPLARKHCESKGLI